MPEQLEEAPFVADIGDVKAVTEGENGLVIKGYAARFTVDEQMEAFEEKAFTEAIDDANQRGLPLLFHHGSLQLGTVDKLELHEGKGLYMEASVDRPEPGTEAADIYGKVARGTMKGLSVGGKFFRRNAKALEPHEATVKIYKAKLREISVTPIAVHSESSILEISTKAFEDEEFAAAEAVYNVERAEVDRKIGDLNIAYSRLEKALEARIALREGAPLI